MLPEAVALTLLWEIGTLLGFVVAGIVAAAIALGLPAYAGYTTYHAATSSDLSNPAALGFGAAFFTALLGLFVAGLVVEFVFL